MMLSLKGSSCISCETLSPHIPSPACYGEAAKKQREGELSGNKSSVAPITKTVLRSSTTILTIKALYKINFCVTASIPLTWNYIW